MDFPNIWIEGSSLVAENVTADGGYAFIDADNPGETLALTNCLITSEILTNRDFGATLLTNAVVYLPTVSAPVYQVAGGGNYYLTNGSPARQTGTTNIDSQLLADLAKKTTWPPSVYDLANISSLGTLTNAASRDTNPFPDIGYHYDPLDYVFGGCDLSSNLIVTAGTAVGWFEDYGTQYPSPIGNSYGVSLNNGAQLSLNGNATQPCYLVPFKMVQEDGNGNWPNIGWSLGFVYNGASTNHIPSISANFMIAAATFGVNTIWGSLGSGTFKNCEFYNSAIESHAEQLLAFTNCLFFREPMYFGANDLSFAIENCTFYNCGLWMYRTGGTGFWQIENASFDDTAIYWNDVYHGASTNTLFDHNAYNTNNTNWLNYYGFGTPLSNKLETVSASDVMVTNYNWETSWFGNFYLPTNSFLIQKGSTTADQMGLYHFTTQTNQIPETNSIVDIGYHYVATDTNGVPLDSNGDGVPDYIEDPLGNGSPYNGTNWALAILTEPTNQIVMQSSNALFSVTAGGVQPLIYQWYSNSVAVAGATNTTFQLSNVQTNISGSFYSVIVTNNFGAITSAVATLTVLVPPVISITNPLSNTIISSNTNISVMAIASDFAGSVTRVQFFAGSTSLGILTNSPYNLVWSNAPTGNYALTAVAIDNYGLMSTSSVVNLFINPLFATNNLVLWLKADSITGLTNNSPIATWLDSSGWADNASQTSQNQKPFYVTNVLNGLPVVQFRGLQFLAIPSFQTSLTQAEGFVVVQATNWPTGSSAYQTLWMFGYNNPLSGNERYPYGDGTIWENFASHSVYQLGQPPIPLSQLNVYQVCSQNNFWEAWLNQLSLFQINNNTVSFTINGHPPTLGNESYGNSFNGNIAEVFVFNRALTTSERITVNAYLNAKYALVPPMPPTPTNLVATAISPNQIGLTWNEPLTNGAATQIIIERSTNGVAFATITTVPDANSYIDTNVASGLTYYYEVQAVNLTQLSSTSNVAQATTPASGTNMPLNSLMLWLKADSGLLQGGSNTPVNYWADQSGNGNNATQPTTLNQPTWIPNALGSHPLIQFNGSNSLFNLPAGMWNLAPTGAEVFVVVQVATNWIGTSRSLWYLGLQNQAHEYFPNTDGTIQESFASSKNYGLGVPPESLTQYNIYDVASQGTNLQAWLDGILQYQATNNIYSPNITTPDLGATLYSGANVWFAGNIAELMIFDRQLTPNERTAVNTYLNGKFGLAPVIPMTPTNLVATAISPNQIGLTWSEPLTNGAATQIAIERSTTSNGTFSVVAQVSDTLSYVDTNVASGTTYYYQVQALNLTTWSPASTLAQAATPSSGAIVPFGNLALWLKADSGLGQAATNVPINLWLDQSGNGNNVQQTSAANEPTWVPASIGGLPTIQFNGTNSYLNFPIFMNTATGAEEFVVLKVSSTNSFHSLWDMGNYNYNANLDSQAYPDVGGSIRDSFGSVNINHIGIPSQPLTQYHVFEVTSQTNYWAAWINGALQFQTTNNTVSFLKNPIPALGMSKYNTGSSIVQSYFAGNIAEVMVFNRPLNVDERTAVGGYLFSKYNLSQYAGNTNSPSVPTNLLATGVSPYQPGFALRWSPASTNETGFVIERRVNGGSYQELTTISGDTTNYTDWIITPTNQYYYKVEAENYFGQSGYSTEISPPSISITNCPQTMLENKTNPIIIAAADPDNSISNVVFFVQFPVINEQIGVATTAPYTVNWIPTIMGSYVVIALATDNEGNNQYSLPVTVGVYLSSNTNGIPNYQLVQQGNNPLNPWIAPAGDTNTSPPTINLVVPANATLLP